MTTRTASRPDCSRPAGADQCRDRHPPGSRRGWPVTSEKKAPSRKDARRSPPLLTFSDRGRKGCYAVRRGQSSHTGASMGALQVVTTRLRLLLQSRAGLAAENLVLRQQVAVLQRSMQRPRLHRRDRVFWVRLSRLYWRWKLRKRCGRPRLDTEICVLIRRTSRDNP